MTVPTILPREIDPNIKHVPGPPEMYGVKFRSACRCGYPGKECGTPSHAYQATQVHAENENRREAEGPLSAPTTATTALRTRAATRAPRSPRTTSGRASGGTCGCGCGETCGGRFRPGHDAKLLSRLQQEVTSGTKSRDDALAELVDSPKLQAKLAGRLS
jgi:hypothetical protein